MKSTTVYLNFSDGEQSIVQAERDDATRNQCRLCQADPYLEWTGGEDAATEPNIEDTLFFASAEAMDKDDLRVLACS